MALLSVQNTQNMNGHTYEDVLLWVMRVWKSISAIRTQERVPKLPYVSVAKMDAMEVKI